MTFFKQRRRIVAGLSIATILIAGCAVPKRATGSNDTNSGPWTGRLALRIDANPPEAFSAAFELTGQAQAGSLILFTPLGSTAATLNWAPGSASLHTASEQRRFESLDALVIHATGAAIPVAALFDWLVGTPTRVNGWEADLTQLALGKLNALRLDPSPPVQLRIVLDR